MILLPILSAIDAGTPVHSKVFPRSFIVFPTLALAPFAKPGLFPLVNAHLISSSDIVTAFGLIGSVIYSSSGNAFAPTGNIIISYKIMFCQVSGAANRYCAGVYVAGCRLCGGTGDTHVAPGDTGMRKITGIFRRFLALNEIVSSVGRIPRFPPLARGFLPCGSRRR